MIIPGTPLDLSRDKILEKLVKLAGKLVLFPSQRVMIHGNHNVFGVTCNVYVFGW